jgi:hypothetical protein
MPERVRSDAHFCQLGPGFRGSCCARLNNVYEPESRQGPPGGIYEERNIRRQTHAAILQCGADELDCFWPERTDTFLSALSEQPDLGRGVEPNGWKVNVNDLLCACPGVVHKLQKSDIAAAEHRRSVNAAKQVLDIGTRKAKHGSGWRSLVRNSQDLLTQRQGGGILHGHKPIQRMNSGEARVARGRCIPALLFQSLKKGQNRVAAEIVEAQIDD